MGFRSWVRDGAALLTWLGWLKGLDWIAWVSASAAAVGGVTGYLSGMGWIVYVAVVVFVWLAYRDGKMRGYAERLRDSHRDDEGTSTPLEDPEPEPTPLEDPEQVSDIDAPLVPDAPPILTESEVYTSEFLHTIRSRCKDLLDTQRTRICEEHRGRMVGIEGVVYEAEERGYEMNVQIQTPGEESVSIGFDKSWGPRIQTLKKGDRIAVLGEFRSVLSNVSFLEGVYLIPLGRPEQEESSEIPVN